ncbi:MAG: hypothetical protein HYV04_01125 [Deltaproteobacteria bacterium]|nr:hypothetical protein [Deltaproteobacteria bacterium]
METEIPMTPAKPLESDQAAPDFAKTLLHVAWLSILLGIVMELLVLGTASGLGIMPGAGVILADTVQKVSWSTIVCVGLAVGTAAANARGPVMGLAGLLAAPAGFTIARTLHRGTLQALGAGVGAAGQPSAIVLAILKGIQYGCLGMAVGWAGQRLPGKATAYVGAGLVVGVVFGGLTLALMSPLPAAALISRGVNEILFPVGCSLVLFTAETLGKRTSR